MKPTPAQLAASAAALIGVAGLTVGMARTKPGPTPPPPALLGAVIPGVTAAQVCDRGYAGRTRNVPESEKAEVFRRAGIPTLKRALYEVDHVVPLSVGGSNTLANLMPQLWDGPEGAHMKDRAEFRAWQEVCAGRLNLAQAQAIFRTPGGWQKALKDFGLDKPHLRAMPGLDHNEEGFPR